MAVGAAEPLDLAPVPGDQRLQLVQPVPVHLQHVGLVLGQDTTGVYGAPGVGAMVGIPDHQDLGPGRMLAGHTHRPSGHIRTILGKEGPVHPGDLGHQPFGEFDHDLTRLVEAVALGHLPSYSVFHLGVVVAQEDRAVAT